MTPDDLRPDTDEIGAPPLARGYCPEGWHDVSECASLPEDPRKSGGQEDEDGA